MSPLADRIDVARGIRKADVLFKNAFLLNLFSGESYPADVAVAEGLIVGIGTYSEGEIILDLKGRYLLPGLIESHIHIESSLLPPREFCKAVLPHGTTTVVIDPHEIGNVLGERGIRFMLDSSRGLPLDIWAMIPSCVPATSMETSGACLGPTEIEKMLKWERVLGLAEVMNYPGVIFKVPEVLQKLEAARRAERLIDGHSPGLSGLDLNAYLTAGPSSDHECTSFQEAQEKLRKGMYIMIREGSAAQNLKELMPLVNENSLRRILLVSDDRHPQDLLQDGHLDHIIRLAISFGLSPLQALTMTTINPAEYFGLKGKGAIAPGYQADLIVVEDPRSFSVKMVFKRGVLVAENGKMTLSISPYFDPEVKNTVRIPPLTADSFRLLTRGRPVRVIELIPGQIITGGLWMDPKIQNGEIVANLERDILKLAVIERHRGSGQIGLGLVKGFGLRQGALGSSVAHDSHNLIIVGENDPDMAVAARAMADMGGGFVVVKEGEILAKLALPIAGLMSDLPIEEVVGQLMTLLDVSRSMGCAIGNPFLALSFLALPVIPQLKLTDQGLVDVGRFSVVGLEEK